MKNIESNNIVSTRHDLWEKRLAKKLSVILMSYVNNESVDWKKNKNIIIITLVYFEDRESYLMQLLEEEHENLNSLFMNAMLNAINDNIKQGNIEKIKKFFFLISEIIPDKNAVMKEEEYQFIQDIFEEFGFFNNKEDKITKDERDVFLYLSIIFYEILKRDYMVLYNSIETAAEQLKHNSWHILFNSLLNIDEFASAEILSYLLYSFKLDAKILFELSYSFSALPLVFFNIGMSNETKKPKLEKILQFIFEDYKFLNLFIDYMFIVSTRYSATFTSFIKILDFYEPHKLEEDFYILMVRSFIKMTAEIKDTFLPSQQILFTRVIKGLIDIYYESFFVSINIPDEVVVLQNANQSLLSIFLESKLVEKLKILDKYIKKTMENNSEVRLEVSTYYSKSLSGDIQIKNKSQEKLLNDKISCLMQYFLTNESVDFLSFITAYPCLLNRMFLQTLRIAGSITLNEALLSEVISTIVKYNSTTESKSEFASIFLKFLSSTYNISSLEENIYLGNFYKEIYEIMIENNCIFYLTNDNHRDYYNFLIKKKQFEPISIASSVDSDLDQIMREMEVKTTPISTSLSRESHIDQIMRDRVERAERFISVI
jgi:hypothetical protein